MPLVMIRRLGLSGMLTLVFAAAVALFGQSHGVSASAATSGGITVSAPHAAFAVVEVAQQAPQRHAVARADLAWPFFSFRRRGAR